MLDPVEREVWFKEYLRAGRKFAPRHLSRDVRAWAKSMSLIAEQFIDNDDHEPADPMPVA